MYVKDCFALILIFFVFIVTVIYIFGFTYSQTSMSSKTSLSASDHIQELIHKYSIVMFSKSTCPYCRKAKNVLSKYKLGDKYYVLELNQLPNTDEYQKELQKITGDRAVPQVFIDGKCIGDEEDIENLDKEDGIKRFEE